VNGFQVAPAELEDLLLKSEDVADAAVIGITMYVILFTLLPSLVPRLTEFCFVVFL